MEKATFHSMISGGKSVYYMEPMGEESPPKGEESPPKGDASPTIPTGWNVKSEHQKDGSVKKSYYCPDTGQHFYTYPSLMRYVNYAKAKQVGPYKLWAKENGKMEDEAMKKSTSIARRKTTSSLSIRGRPPSPPRPPNSYSAAKNDGSKSFSSGKGKSNDEEKDDDYVLQYADVSTHLAIGGRR